MVGCVVVSLGHGDRLGGSRIWTASPLLLRVRLSTQMVCFRCRVLLLCLTGLDKNFNQWDPLIDGEDEHLIKGTNVITLQSAIWMAFTRCSTHPLDCWPSARQVPPGALWNSPASTDTGLWRTCGLYSRSSKKTQEGSSLPHQQDSFLSADKLRLCIHYLHVHKAN